MCSLVSHFALATFHVRLLVGLFFITAVGDVAVKILVLQLKRIGDLILTAPALAALRRHFPEAHLTLAVNDSAQELLPALPMVDATLVYHHHRGGNAALWWRMARSSYDVCLDFTGTDRTALFALLSKAARRLTFSWVKKSPTRHLGYNHFVESSVRERHTSDHYSDLLTGLGIPFDEEPLAITLPDWPRKKAHQLLDARHRERGFALIHPGTARPEKYWPAERWAEVIQHLETVHQLPCVITGGTDPYEQEHIQQIEAALPLGQPHARDLSGRTDLLTLAALTAEARVVLSVDTGAMHLAAAFQTPQLALFGPTNPFHWRPRHPRAIIMTGSSPEPVHEFTPRSPGAPMNNLSTLQIIRAMDTLIASTPPDAATSTPFR